MDENNERYDLTASGAIANDQPFSTIKQTSLLSAVLCLKFGFKPVNETTLWF